MTKDHQWSRWYAHCGTRCPVARGVPVQVYVDMGPETPEFGLFEGVGGAEGASWYWSNCVPTDRIVVCRILRYRIRRSSSFEMIEQLVENRRPVERPQNQPREVA